MCDAEPGIDCEISAPGPGIETDAPGGVAVRRGERTRRRGSSAGCGSELGEQPGRSDHQQRQTVAPYLRTSPGCHPGGDKRVRAGPSKFSNTTSPPAVPGEADRAVLATSRRRVRQRRPALRRGGSNRGCGAGRRTQAFEPIPQDLQVLCDALFGHGVVGQGDCSDCVKSGSNASVTSMARCRSDAATSRSGSDGPTAGLSARLTHSAHAVAPTGAPVRHDVRSLRA